MAKRKYIYIATLYRFGYDITAVDTSADKARNAIIENYIKSFESINGFHPDDEESDRSADGRTWLEDAIEDIEVLQMELGKVEWR